MSSSPPDVFPLEIPSKYTWVKEVHEKDPESGELVFLFYVDMQHFILLSDLYEAVMDKFEKEFFDDEKAKKFPGREKMEVRFETEPKPPGSYHKLPDSYEDFDHQTVRIVLIEHP